MKHLLLLLLFAFIVIQINAQQTAVENICKQNKNAALHQQDILNTVVVRPVVTETTALGAAYLAGLAVGFWKNMEAIQDQWQADKKFNPAMKDETRIKLSKEWQRSVKAAKAWADE